MTKAMQNSMSNKQSYTVSCKKKSSRSDYKTTKTQDYLIEKEKKTGMVMSIFII